LGPRLRARSPPLGWEPLVQDEKLRRSSRAHAPPNRFGYNGTQRAGYIANFAPLCAAFRIPAPEIYRAVASDPDLLTFDQAMKDHPNVQRWLEAADLQVRTLERMGMWVEVPNSEATSRIIPGTWAFRCKRSPDGEVKKYKARFCVRGDLQEGTFNTYTPLVAWSTVCFLLVSALSFNWITTSIDFASAFVQATLNQPIWIHLPSGYRSCLGPNTCIRLVKSLYGLSVTPRLWFEHLSRALKSIGLTQSRYDQCLFYGQRLLLGLYCVDGCIVAESHAVVDEFLGHE
jgi:Reverse transcriptase (RNA-dependent DNA polymerase)